MRILMWFAMGFAGACGLGAYLWVDDAALLFALGFLMLGIAAGFLRKQRFHGRICVILLGLALGLFWFRVYDGLYVDPLRELDGQVIPLTITATDFSQDTGYGSQVDGWFRYENRYYKVRLYLTKRKAIFPGDVVEVEARVRMTSDGGQSEPTYHRSNGIFLIANQRKEATITPASKLPWYGIPAVLRQRILALLEQTLPEREAAFGKALLLGDRRGLSYETTTAFRVTGVQHLVAVSGLHVSILFGLICTLTGRRRWLLFLMEVPVLLLFAAVAGFTPSVNRAVIMQLLMLLASLVEREYDPPTELAAAVLTMLVANPLVIASVGFQLSVASVTGIFLFSDPVRSWLLHPKRLGTGRGKTVLARLARWVASTTGVTIGATVMTTPLVAIHFGTVSLVGLLTNLLVLWCITGIFYGLLLTCVVGAVFLPLGKLLGLGVSVLMDYVLTVSITLSKFPLAAVYTRSVYIVAWLVFCYVLLAVFLLFRKRRPVVLVCCGVIGLCVALLASWMESYLDNYRVSILDVGQGQCILIQNEGSYFMIDCGGTGDTAVADLAAETLLSQGIAGLDGLILTHYDEDHAGAVEYFLTRIPTDALYLPGAAEHFPDETAGFVVDEDLVLTMDKGSLTLFAPEFSGSNNESSLAILYRYEDWDMLITGDRTALAEKMLLERFDLPDLEVLVVGHHGSGTSTCAELLEATHPEIGVISVGKDNRYGHPKQEVLDRLGEYGCRVYRTDQDGTVVFRG